MPSRPRHHRKRGNSPGAIDSNSPGRPGPEPSPLTSSRKGDRRLEGRPSFAPATLNSPWVVAFPGGDGRPLRRLPSAADRTDGRCYRAGVKSQENDDSVALTCSESRTGVFPAHRSDDVARPARPTVGLMPGKELPRTPTYCRSTSLDGTTNHLDTLIARLTMIHASVDHICAVVDDADEVQPQSVNLDEPYSCNYCWRCGAMQSEDLL